MIGPLTIPGDLYDLLLLDLNSIVFCVPGSNHLWYRSSSTEFHGSSFLSSHLREFADFVFFFLFSGIRWVIFSNIQTIMGSRLCLLYYLLSLIVFLFAEVSGGFVDLGHKTRIGGLGFLFLSFPQLALNHSKF